jgi:hypothetical protein
MLGTTSRATWAIPGSGSVVMSECGLTGSARDGRTATFEAGKTEFSTGRKQVDFAFPCCG